MKLILRNKYIDRAQRPKKKRPSSKHKSSKKDNNEADEMTTKLTASNL